MASKTSVSRSKSSERSERKRSRSPTKSKVRTRRLLVSNIPFNVSMKELKDLFKEKIGICGQLDYIDHNGKFSGNATMEFKTLDGAQKAVESMHKESIGGRELIVREETNKDRERLGLNDSSPQFGMPDSMRGNGSVTQLIEQLEREGPITNSLFMANLHYSLSWQKLKDMFKSAGRVRHVELKVDSDGTSRGFGTVEFETPEEAIMAVHLFNNKVINNREIKLRMDKSGKNVAGRLDLSRIGEGPQQGNNYNPQIRRVFEDLMTGISNPGNGNPQAMKALNELVALSQMFDKSQAPSRLQYEPPMPKGYDRNPMMGPGGGGMRGGFGGDFAGPNMFVDNYMQPPMYDNMYQKNSSFSKQMLPEMGRGHRDRFSPPPKQSSNQVSNNEMAMLEDILTKMRNNDQQSLVTVLNSVLNKKGGESSHSATNNFGNSRFNEFSTAQSNTLLVKNIPFLFTWKDLKHSFSQAPGIVNTEIMRDDFNRSKGVGLVQFQSSSDAMRCKNMMDGTLLDGRPINIDFSHSMK